MPCLGRRTSLFDRRMKGCFIGDDVIGRHEQDHGVWIAAQGQKGGRCSRRRRIAGAGLQQNGLRSLPEAAQALGNKETVIVAGNDDRGREARGIADAADSPFEKAAVTDEGQKLLWIFVARQRPQTGARPARQDDRHDPAATNSHAPSAFNLAPAKRLTLVRPQREPDRNSRT
ncbi:hypothetical protein GCM10007276_15970 [Agaricicola taiwanensis]|uniref:Uncharacterized protein n=1 Tax=Agaricicola taiwanensis TaxID=591372 RepID=A0A8J2YH05_9RHOB|nr:hypothetical protein GCM10007276_15970 [Agaricicola taiwanensis]